MQCTLLALRDVNVMTANLEYCAFTAASGNVLSSTSCSTTVACGSFGSCCCASPRVSAWLKLLVLMLVQLMSCELSACMNSKFYCTGCVVYVTQVALFCSCIQEHAALACRTLSLNAS
jgi:hypothetical protein